MRDARLSLVHDSLELARILLDSAVDAHRRRQDVASRQAYYKAAEIIEASGSGRRGSLARKFTEVEQLIGLPKPPARETADLRTRKASS
jgi:hypothetical protein